MQEPQLLLAALPSADTDVNRYLWELDPHVPATYPEPVTLRHLLTHTAGFDNLAGIYTSNERELVSAGLYLRAHTPPRVRPPGELTAYSNYGAALAAYLVEATQNQPFTRYAPRSRSSRRCRWTAPRCGSRFLPLWRNGPRRAIATPTAR